MIDAGIILVETYAEFPADVLEELQGALDDGAVPHTNVEFAYETSFASDAGIRFRTRVPCVTAIDQPQRAPKKSYADMMHDHLARLYGGAAFGVQREWWL